MQARLIIDRLVEKLELRGSYKLGAFQRLVAASYMGSPELDPSTLPLYRLLSDKIVAQNKMLSSRYTFEPGQHDPYHSMKALKQDVDAQRSAGNKKPTVRVFAEPPGEGKGHPALTNDVNVMLRGVHDVIAHLAGSHPFSGRGEYGAYNRHLRTLPPKLAPILFTEIVAQTSCYYAYGMFVDQKAVFLPDYDPLRVGALSQGSALNHFFVLQDKVLQPVKGFSWAAFCTAQPALSKELKRQVRFDPSEWDAYSVDADRSALRR